MAYKEKDTKKWTAQWFETNAKGEKKKRRKRGFETKREALEYERQKKLNNSRSMDMKLSEFMEVYFESWRGRIQPFMRGRNCLRMWRRSLLEQAEQLKTQIANMKQYLSCIVQGYGYKNVKEFLAEYKASKAEYTDYQSAVARWEQQTGNKVEPDSLKARLQRKQQEVKERENNRQSHHYRADRGSR